MKRKIKPSSVDVPDEIIPDYSSDTSDEDHVNTIGNVPLEWYDDHDHIGYDLLGQKIRRPTAVTDALDTFLNNVDNPDTWRSVIDPLTGSSLTLSNEDISLLKRAFENKYPDEQYDPSVPEPKRRFIPSKIEAQRIMKIVRAIRKGLISTSTKKETPEFYDIWDGAPESVERKMHIPPPKLPLPDHKESYRPPIEYLPSPNDEIEEGVFVPKRFTSLRLVPAYQKFINERFDRCLDLYLCPRMIKNRINVDPESLIPKLPSRRELEPFPSRCSMVYEGHTSRIRSIAFDPSGKWFISGSDDGTARCWDILSGRLVKTWKINSEVHWVAWNPNAGLSIVALAAASEIYFVIPPVVSDAVKKSTQMVESLLQKEFSGDCCTWRKPSDDEKSRGISFVVSFKMPITSVVWHRKGEYFASVSPEAGSAAVVIHHLLRKQSQTPFKKAIGLVQKVLFHPLKPELVICTQQGVRLYNLVKQDLAARLYPGVKWISSIDVHPKGDHIILGSYDKKLCWFDLDLSPKPYKILRYHTHAIRNVSFHRRYPLFASCSDDGTVNVFHSMVYSDLDRNPLIVPVKSLKAHDIKDNLGVLFSEFHPSQPWVFSCGWSSNGFCIKLFT
ncbi:NUC169 domain-containing protein [Chytridium lagenaria]|nr:NUC169 domain-containing protein [Chytridium lagenaria]